MSRSSWPSPARHTDTRSDIGREGRKEAIDGSIPVQRPCPPPVPQPPQPPFVRMDAQPAGCPSSRGALATARWPDGPVGLAGLRVDFSREAVLDRLDGERLRPRRLHGANACLGRRQRGDARHTVEDAGRTNPPLVGPGTLAAGRVEDQLHPSVATSRCLSTLPTARAVTAGCVDFRFLSGPTWSCRRGSSRPACLGRREQEPEFTQSLGRWLFAGPGRTRRTCLSRRNHGFVGITDAWPLTHRHAPSSSTHTFVNRDARSKGLPSLSLPTSL